MKLRPAPITRGTGSDGGEGGGGTALIERAIVPAVHALTAARGAVYAEAVETLSLPEITRRVSELKLEHRNLDAEIDRLVADIQADELAVKRLKKRKLWLKDCISRFESALIPDEPA